MADELSAEVRDRIEHELDVHRSMAAPDNYDAFFEDLCALLAAYDAARVDAERYQFIKAHKNYQGSLNGYPTFEQAVDSACVLIGGAGEKQR